MFKDYYEMIWKPSCKWVKKHWKGYFVLCIILTAIECTWIYKESITDWLSKRFKKNEEES